MKTYHQLRALTPAPIAPPRLATIHAIQGATASLRLPNGAITQKYYRLNPAVTFAAGQRVHVQHLCGTYLVTARV